MILGKYINERPNNITGNDKCHLKCDCVTGSIVNGIREPVLFSLALSSPPSHKIFIKPSTKLHKKINKPVLSHRTFYLQDDDHKPVNFNGEIIGFTCELIKTKFKKTNLNMIRPKKEAYCYLLLLLSITKNCETLIKQTHRKAEETLEIKLSQTRQIFHFNPPISIEGSWMIGLTSLEVYNSIFKITEKNKKLEIYRHSSDKFSIEELKDELGEILSYSDITTYHLDYDKKRPRNIDTYRRIGLEKSSTDGYIILVMAYARSSFRDIESYLRIVVGLDEDDIQLILKQNSPFFVTHELSPGIYTIKDDSEATYTMGDHEGTLKNEYDDINMKTKLILTRVGGSFGKLRFVEKSFSITLLSFTPYWDCKPNNAVHVDNPGVHTSEKDLNLCTTKKLQLKCDVIAGSIVDGLRQPVHFSFVLDKPSGCKVFCEPETLHYKKNKEICFDYYNFYLEDDNHKEVEFNREILTFTLRMIKI